MSKALSTLLREYIESKMEERLGYEKGNTPKKYAEYSKIRRGVSLHIGETRPLTYDGYSKAIEYVNNYFNKKDNSNTKEYKRKVYVDSATKIKFGTYENFFNCTVNRYDDTSIDKELLPILKILNRNGAYTVSSCYGHSEQSNCYIMFASFIHKKTIVDALASIGINEKMYMIERITHNCGFKYFKIVMLSKEIIPKKCKSNCGNCACLKCKNNGNKLKSSLSEETLRIMNGCTDCYLCMTYRKCGCNSSEKSCCRE